jgi:hypothetical protein
MNRTQWIVLASGGLVCIAMWIYPPYIDGAILSPGPTYAPITSPPAAVNEGGMSIDWDVLFAQWAIVGLIATGVWLSLCRPPKFSRIQRCVLWSGAVVAVCRLLYPPYIGGGPLGVHYGTASLFHRASEMYIWSTALQVDLAVITAATLAAFWFAGYVGRRFQGNLMRSRTA